MARGLLEFLPIGEHAFDQPLHAPMTVALRQPVVHRQHSRHADCRHRVAFRDQVRILGFGELADRVIVGQRFRVWDWYQVHVGVGRKLGKEIDRPSDHPDQRGDLAFSQHLQRPRIVVQGLLHLDARALEDNRPGQA
jgi:hypothetical protein